MAEFEIDVVVDPSGARRGSRAVRGELNRVQRDADSLRRSITAAFAFGAIAFGIRQLASLADAYTNVQNRIKVVTDSTEELNEVTERLFQISNQTRSSFEATATIYARTASAVQNLGVSQRETLAFTNSLNQAVGLSGATGAEAAAGLIQLSQGLASGTLRGDELRSVLEQLPVVADVIADSLGVTRGELRQLGTDGKINAQIIIDAFAEAANSLDERFSELEPTIGSAFAVLRNNLLQVIGNFDQVSGASTSFANFILILGQNMDTLARAALAAGIALSISFARRGVLVAVSAVQALTVAIAANPLGAIAVGATVAISALIAFSDQINIGNGNLANLQDLATVTFDLINRGFESIQAAAENAFGFIGFIAGETANVIGSVFGSSFTSIATASESAFQGVELSITGVLRLAAIIADSLVQVFVGVFNSIVAVFRNLRPAVGEQVINLINSVQREFADFINFLIDGFNSISSSLNGPQIDPVSFEESKNEFAGAGAELGAIINKEIENAANIDIFGGALDNLIDEANQLSRASANAPTSSANLDSRNTSQVPSVQNIVAAQGASAANDSLPPSFAELINELQLEADLLKLSDDEREIAVGLIDLQTQSQMQLTDAQRNQATELIETIQALQNQAEVLDFIRGPQEDYIATLETVNQLLDAQKISLEERDQILASTQLASAVSDIQSDLNPEAAETERLQESLLERQLVIDQAIEARILSEEEGLLIIQELNQQTQEAILNSERERAALQLGAASDTFSTLGQLTSKFAGEQSTAAKTLFGISKAFAIAEATVKISQGVANALSLGFPAGIVAAASVAAQAAGLIQTIQGAQFEGGFQNGGDFMVGGSGGTDSQSVSFQATPGERVTVETPQQQRSNDGEAPAPQQNDGGGVRILNVIDPGMVEDFLTSSSGEKTLLNVIERNSGSINATLQG